MVRSTNPRDELVAARRAVEEAARHVRAIRMYATTSRLAGRLETDVRRVMEDLDDLTAEEGAGPTVAVASRPGFSPAPAAGPAGPPAEPVSPVGAGQVGPAEPVGAGPAGTVGPAGGPLPPVPVPDRMGEPDFHPECDDEGVGGGWRSAEGPAAGRRRRSRS
jgi:hypothetical protein